MSIQLHLIKPEKKVPNWIASLFHNANAGNYDLKQTYFYSLFKQWFLEKYANKSNIVEQTIKKKCWTCDNGTYISYHADGSVYSTDYCWDCNGTGIHATRIYYLQKYILNNKIYHIPIDNVENIKYAEIISGKIEHTYIEPKKAQNSALILFLLYRPFIIKRIIKRRIFIFSRQWKYRLIKQPYYQFMYWYEKNILKIEDDLPF